MSAESPPEFFADRNLGRTTAAQLRERLGWTVHLVGDVFENDAQDVEDEQWIAYGCARGWVLLTKDKNIRFRRHEISALTPDGFLFCLSTGRLDIEGQVDRFVQAAPSIVRAARAGRPGFWTIYDGGRIVHRWSTDDA